MPPARRPTGCPAVGCIKVKVGDVGHGGAAADGGGVGVDPFGDLGVAGAEQLGAQEPSGAPVTRIRIGMAPG